MLRYGPSSANHCVDVFEIGNEPYWGVGGESQSQYTSQAGPAIDAVHAADPSARATLAIGDSLGWIDAMNSAGLLGKPDFFTHHPYCNGNGKYADPTVWDPNAADWNLSCQRIIKLHDRLVQLGHTQSFLLTENGWHSTPVNQPAVCRNGVCLTEAQQADYITKMFQIVRGLPWVAGLYYYTVGDNPQATPCGTRSDSEAHYGLRRCDNSLKPAWSAFSNG